MHKCEYEGVRKCVFVHVCICMSVSVWMCECEWVSVCVCVWMWVHRCLNERERERERTSRGEFPIRRSIHSKQPRPAKVKKRRIVKTFVSERRNGCFIKYSQDEVQRLRQRWLDFKDHRLSQTVSNRMMKKNFCLSVTPGNIVVVLGSAEPTSHREFESFNLKKLRKTRHLNGDNRLRKNIKKTTTVL